MEMFEVTEHRILQTYPGKSLEGWVFRHPFIERDSVGVLADYVTLEQATGAVHTAPGHGREDYETGQAYGLEVHCPVDDHGRFYKNLPLFGGMTVWDANPKIVEHLESTGALIARERIEHTYPHCWRCRNPVIFRATPQWFISMEHNKLREKALEEIRRVGVAPRLGAGAYLRNDREPARLVHLPPADLGRSHHGLLVQGLRRSRDRPADRRARRGADGEGKGPTPGSIGASPISRRTDSSAPRAARRASRRSWISWTSGLIRA